MILVKKILPLYDEIFLHSTHYFTRLYYIHSLLSLFQEVFSRSLILLLL